MNEIRRNGPSQALYFSLLLHHPTHLHACPRCSAQGTRAVGRSVGGIKFPSYSGVQIHSLGGRAFQAVGSAKCVISVSISRWCAWQHL